MHFLGFSPSRTKHFVVYFLRPNRIVWCDEKYHRNIFTPTDKATKSLFLMATPASLRRNYRSVAGKLSAVEDAMYRDSALQKTLIDLQNRYSNPTPERVTKVNAAENRKAQFLEAQFWGVLRADYEVSLSFHHPVFIKPLPTLSEFKIGLQPDSTFSFPFSQKPGKASVPLPGQRERRPLPAEWPPPLD